jgi:Protein of unknown function (DUF2721)
MAGMQTSDLIPVLQIAVGPVILISGAGLVLLSLTNRFGRAVDRTRQLVSQLRSSEPAQAGSLAMQVDIMYRRARLIQISIVLCAMSILLVAVLIITLFVEALMKWESPYLIISFFVFALLSLVGSLVTFMMDIQLSLRALNLELDR